MQKIFQTSQNNSHPNTKGTNKYIDGYYKPTTCHFLISRLSNASKHQE
jgi:hypothetical protein